MSTTAETAYDPADPARNDEIYVSVLHITKLVHAAEMLADATPVLHTPGAPPIQHLLERALGDLDKLAHRVSP